MTQLVARCNRCGCVERPDKDIWLHKFVGTPGYGSLHDGDKVYLYFCSECLDSMVRTDNLYDRDQI